MAPFGPENQKPVFEAQNIYVYNALSSMRDRHVRFIAAQEGCESTFWAVGFDLIDYYERLSLGDSFRMAFTIEENTYNGNTSIQLRVKDIKFE